MEINEKYPIKEEFTADRDDFWYKEGDKFILFRINGG